MYNPEPGLSSAFHGATTGIATGKREAIDSTGSRCRTRSAATPKRSRNWPLDSWRIGNPAEGTVSGQLASRRSTTADSYTENGASTRISNGLSAKNVPASIPCGFLLRKPLRNPRLRILLGHSLSLHLGLCHVVLLERGLEKTQEHVPTSARDAFACTSTSFGTPPSPLWPADVCECWSRTTIDTSLA